jgi:hypothetical protein
VRLVRRASRDRAKWGIITGTYSVIRMFQAVPEKGDLAALKNSLESSVEALSALTLPPLWPLWPRGRKSG